MIQIDKEFRILVQSSEVLQLDKGSRSTLIQP